MISEDVHTCECGCGQPTKWDRNGKRWNRWRQGHQYRYQVAPGPSEPSAPKPFFRPVLIPRYFKFWEKT